MNQPLTIPQAEAVLTQAAGHPVKVWSDFNGYFARKAPGDYLAFYDDWVFVYGQPVVVLVPAVGDWPTFPVCGGEGCDRDCNTCPVRDILETKGN